MVQAGCENPPRERGRAGVLWCWEFYVFPCLECLKNETTTTGIRSRSCAELLPHHRTWLQQPIPPAQCWECCRCASQSQAARASFAAQCEIPHKHHPRETKISQVSLSQWELPRGFPGHGAGAAASLPGSGAPRASPRPCCPRNDKKQQELSSWHRASFTSHTQHSSSSLVHSPAPSSWLGQALQPWLRLGSPPCAQNASPSQVKWLSSCCLTPDQSRGWAQGWLPFAGWICCPNNLAQNKFEGTGGEANLRFHTSWWPKLTGPELLFHHNLSAFKAASADREKTREKHPCRCHLSASNPCS